MLTLRTQSFRRYRLRGGLPSPFTDGFHERLAARRFQPLTANEERTYGWVTADNLLRTDFGIETVVRGEYAGFALRLDRRRVSPRLLRAHLDLEVHARLEAAREAGGPARLSREERKDLREELRQELLRRANPAVDAWTVLVHPKRRLALVLTLSRVANELVQLHMRDTFDVEMDALTPWRRAEELLEAPATARRVIGGLPTLERTEWGATPTPTRARAREAAVGEGRAGEARGGEGRGQ